jgi:hypothetical protein
MNIMIYKFRDGDASVQIYEEGAVDLLIGSIFFYAKK